MNAREIIYSIFGTMFKVVLAAIIIMLVYKWTIYAYDYGYRVFAEPPISTGEGREITVTVEKGDGASNIGEQLQRKGLIRDAKLFRIQERLSEYKDSLKPGTYILNTSMTSDQMMEIMSKESDNDEAAESGNKIISEPSDDTSNEDKEVYSETNDSNGTTEVRSETTENSDSTGE